jgi:hypothetical protein
MICWIWRMVYVEHNRGRTSVLWRLYQMPSSSRQPQVSRPQLGFNPRTSNLKQIRNRVLKLTIQSKSAIENLLNLFPSSCGRWTKQGHPHAKTGLELRHPLENEDLFKHFRCYNVYASHRSRWAYPISSLVIRSYRTDDPTKRSWRFFIDEYVYYTRETGHPVDLYSCPWQLSALSRSCLGSRPW